ncbi:MAG: hypothetical protein ACJ789_07215 [Thermomicrobiales bacterium]
MIAFDRPEILEPEVEETGSGAGQDAPDEGAPAPDDEDSDD